MLQFGTGVLLRGLPDFLIDQANRQGLFNGRVVVVKSTDGGDAAAFERQDNLYTVCIRGIEDGQPVRQDVVCASLSRVLSARSQWADVLTFAASPDLQLVLSNTTEVGIVLDADDDVRAAPPRSFPGKLLAVLLARYEAFAGAADKGLVIVPTELIPDNGTKLRGILRELAESQVPDVGFLHWLENANTVCNSLVDRIVPGKPDAATCAALAQELGYNETTDFHDPEDARWSARPFNVADLNGQSGLFSEASIKARVNELALEQPYSELDKVTASLEEYYKKNQKRQEECKDRPAGPIPRYRRFQV